MKRCLTLILLFLVSANAFALGPGPMASPSQNPDVADYPPFELSIKGASSGAGAKGGTAAGIVMYFCPWIIQIPLKKIIMVPQAGASECIAIKGFPQFCPWPFFYRVRVTILKQPKCGATVVATPQIYDWNNAQVCFNVNMQNSTCPTDFFIYRLEYPRSSWVGWFFGWPGFLSRVAVMQISKSGNY